MTSFKLQELFYFCNNFSRAIKKYKFDLVWVIFNRGDDVNEIILIRAHVGNSYCNVYENFKSSKLIAQCFSTSFAHVVRENKVLAIYIMESNLWY